MFLTELFEAGSKHVTFCFGRMNPPTIGHKQVLDTMKKQGGDMKIFVSQSQDAKKNPLDYGTKIKFIKEMFPEYAGNLVDDAGLNTVVKVASYLYDQGYTAATFVAGSDRLEDMKKLLDAYNGVEGKSHGFYKFEVLDFVSSGEREDGAEGVAGVSASGARAAAANNNFESFKEATGAGELAKPLFIAVRKGMKIAESVNEVSLGNKLEWPEVVNKVNSAMKAMGWKGQRKGDDAYMFSTAGQEVEDQIYIVIIDNNGNGMFTYALGTVEEGDPHIGEQETLPMTEASVSELMNAIRDGFGLGEAMSEAPIEMDPSDPMDPMIHSHDKANPAKLKYRMLRAAGQLKDLASRAENASPGEWQLMARQFEELKMNMEQIRHALEELGKMRKKGGIRSRGIDPMVDSVSEGYGRYYCSTDKKWKTRKGPKQSRKSS